MYDLHEITYIFNNTKKIYQELFSHMYPHPCHGKEPVQHRRSYIKVVN